MSATYVPGVGIQLTLQGADEGVTIGLRTDMTIAAMERYLKELREFLS